VHYKAVLNLDTRTTSIIYPRRAAVIVQGQAPRGVYVVCQGSLKLSVGSSDGRPMILGIVEPGEVIGLNATVSNTAYGVTAEALEPCQVNFIKREDFLQFLTDHKQVSFGDKHFAVQHIESAM
jgi:CRP/FNR family transcriptional regulator